MITRPLLTPMSSSPEGRAAIDAVLDLLAKFESNVRDGAVAPVPDAGATRAWLSQFDFAGSVPRLPLILRGG